MGRRRQRFAGLAQRQRIGFLALECIAAEHHAEKAVEALGCQQGRGEVGRLVGQARHLQASGLQQRKALQHAGIDIRKIAVDGQVMALIPVPRRGIERRRGPDMGQHRTHQVLRSFADQPLDGVAFDLRQPQLFKHPVQRHHEVTQRVHHGSVQVDDHRLQRRQFQFGLHGKSVSENAVGSRCLCTRRARLRPGSRRRWRDSSGGACRSPQRSPAQAGPGPSARSCRPARPPPPASPVPG